MPRNFRNDNSRSSVKTEKDMGKISTRGRQNQTMETFSALLALCEGNPPVTGGFPLTKASGAELWRFLWSAPEQTVGQTIETPAIGDAIAFIMTSLKKSQRMFLTTAVCS